LPDGQDPDDFARKHTLQEVQDYIPHNEQDFIGFKTDLLLEEAGSDPLKKANLINDIADTIALIPDAIVRTMYVRATAAKFEIDEQLLLERISTSRTAMLEAELKQREREKQRIAGGQRPQPVVAPGPQPVVQPASYEGYIPPPEYNEYDMGGADHYAGDVVPVYEEPTESGPVLMNAPEFVACEKELLKFILEDGCSQLMFDRDSKYYIEGESVCVAEFIDGTFAEDEYEFENLSYRKVYNEYFKLYDEGLTQEKIQTRLMNSMDEEIAAVAKDLLIEKYQITVENYEKSLTANSTRLVMFVPKALMAYQIKKLDKMISDLMAGLTSNDDLEAQVETLTRISDLTRTRTMLNKELGRV
jgi:DNA primase